MSVSEKRWPLLERWARLGIIFGLSPLIGALKEAPAWVEFNGKNLLYSIPYDIALRESRRLRYPCLAGMDIDMMVRCMGQVDYPTLKEFMEKMATMSREAKNARVTTPVGGDIKFRMPKIKGAKPDSPLTASNWVMPIRLGRI